MELTELQQSRLLAYFENQLTPEEELAFLEETANNEVLKEEFNREMLWRTALEEEQSYKTAAGFETADEHLSITAKAIASQQTVHQLSRRRVIWQLAGAAVVVAALAAAFFYNKNNAVEGMTVVRIQGISLLTDYGKVKPPDEDSVNSLPENTTAVNDAERAREMYRTLFKRYIRQGDEPVQIDKYLMAYNQKKYSVVLNSSSEDYATKGMGEDSLFLERYMDFYRALCLLETGKPKLAIALFQKVMVAAKSGSQLQQSAAKYLKLAYLQAGNLQKGRRFC